MQMPQDEPALCLPPALGRAWLALSGEQQEAFLSASDAAQALALRVGCMVAEATSGVAHRPSPMIGRKGEKDVLEMAARDLQQVVLHTAGTGQAMDGQIPLYVQGGRGRVGIEVKTCQGTVSGDEVAKFLRDVTSNDFAAAILVSTRSPIARRRRGLEVERVASVRGTVWCIFLSPVHDMAGLVTGGLALALELAVSSPSSRMPQAMGEKLQHEVHVLAGVKRKLREDDARAASARDSVQDSLTTAQLRLIQAVDSLLQPSGIEAVDSLLEDS